MGLTEAKAAVLFGELCNTYGASFVFQGKGLFAKKSIKKGETVFLERPLVSAQFLWNSLYKYKGTRDILVHVS